MFRAQAGPDVERGGGGEAYKEGLCFLVFSFLSFFFPTPPFHCSSNFFKERLAKEAQAYRQYLAEQHTENERMQAEIDSLFEAEAQKV